MSAKRLRLDALCKDLCRELGATPIAPDSSVVQIRGREFQQILDDIEIAKFKIELTDTIMTSMAAPSPVGYSQHVMSYSIKRKAYDERFWLKRRLVCIRPWSEKTHGSLDENDRLVAVMLAMFRISTQVEWKIIHYYDFLYLFQALCVSTLIDEDTAEMYVCWE